MRSAISSNRAAYRSAKRCRISARWLAGRNGQSVSSNACRAAATAASMSAGVPSGTRAMTSSVCGEMTSIVADDAGAIHLPSM
jgi:hypothetical protein